MKFIKQACLGILLFIFCYSQASAEKLNWGHGWVYIQNVHTGLVIDKQGNVGESGTKVWPYLLNYSDAQLFRFVEFDIPDIYGENAVRVKSYYGDDPFNDVDLYITLKKTPMRVVNVPRSSPQADSGNVALTSLNLFFDSSISGTYNKKTLTNHIFTIEEKLDAAESLPLLPTSPGLAKQLWIPKPVPNESDTYYLHSAQFPDLVIEPLDFSSGGTLVLSSFTGSDLQKWRITASRPKPVTAFKLHDFKWKNPSIFAFWKDPKISGTLTWNYSASDAASSIKENFIYLSREGSTIGIYTLAANENSLKFSKESSKASRDKEHCFNLRSKSQWHSENFSFADEICGVPNFYVPPPPTPTTQPVGVGKLSISNCHSDRKSVVLWTYDLTNDNGTWNNEGSLAHQWSGTPGGCPIGSPKEITLSDNHVYALVAIDCGNSPPPQSQATCWRLMSSQIQGGANGATLPFQIN